MSLGEPAGTPADREHLAGCAECTRRIAEFASVVAAGRGGPAEGLLQPSDRVWSGISATLGLSPDLAPDAAWREEPEDGSPGEWQAATPQTSPPAPAAEPATAADDREPVAPVTPLSSRGSARARRGAWLAVAAGLVVVGGVGTAVVLGTLGPGQGDVVAEATLDALPDWPDARGIAVVRDADGARTLDVTVSPDSRPDAVREVWLISSDLTKLVSVGLLATDEGTFALPPDIDLDEYTVVDVSSEPLDGDPAHSADSIVRGALRSA
jgi:hypothetical protein